MNKYIKKFVYIFIWLVVTLILSGVIECISRGDFQEGYEFIKNNIDRFIVGYLLMLLSTVWIFILKKRVFWLSIIYFMWIILAISNYVILIFRGSPLTGTDFGLIKDGITILNQYITSGDFIKIGIIFSVVILVLSVIWKYDRRIKNINLKITIPVILCAYISIIIILSFQVNRGVVEKQFADLFYAYKSNGFIYSLCNTTFNKGMDKPQGYSQQQIYKAITNLKTPEDINSSNPNIIIVQLESFFDVHTMKNLNFNKDVIPNFRHLQENSIGGYINVPAIGGGTANTEFEVITGMNLDYFSNGEFPYNSVLKKTTTPTIAYELLENNYNTHFLHNHEGTFYDRYKIYSNLGFETFTSIENMYGYERNETGWVKDDVLIKEIENIINSTEKRDFIYAVSVQGHGGYPDNKILSDPEIMVSGDINESEQYSWEYYVNQIHQMDKFIGELVNKINSLDEEVVIAFLGDHLPALGIDEDNIISKDKYKTSYVIYNNKNNKKANINIESYELASTILNSIGLGNNIISRLHNNEIENKDGIFKLIQYDILYGKRYSLNNINKIYNPTNMKLGFRDIIIKDIVIQNNETLIIGENFTNHSKVYIDEKQYETEFIDSNTLKIKTNINSDKEVISVKQVGRNGVILGSS